MKTILFTLLLSSLTLLSTNAQTTETLSELTPVASNIGKFTKNVPRFKNIINDNEDVKFKAKVELIDLPDGKKAIATTIQTTYYELVFETRGNQIIAIPAIY